MFHELIESGARRRRHTGWTLASSGFHALLIAGAVTATLQQKSGQILYTAPIKPPVYVTVEPRTKTVSPQRSGGVPVPVITAPTRIPVSIPAIPDVSLSSEQHFRVGPESFDNSTGLLATRPDPENAVHSVDRVERAVVPRPDNGHPVYPTALRAAAIEGEVLVQFVVDTSGRVEVNSIEIVRATHHLFGDAVRRWLHRTRYHPAEIQNRPVRQLVQQQIGFTVR